MTVLSLLSIIPSSTTVRVLQPDEHCSIEIIGMRYAVEQACNCLDLCKKEVALLDKSKEGEITLLI